MIGGKKEMNYKERVEIEGIRIMLHERFGCPIRPECYILDITSRLWKLSHKKTWIEKLRFKILKRYFIENICKGKE